MNESMLWNSGAISNNCRRQALFPGRLLAALFVSFLFSFCFYPASDAEAGSPGNENVLILNSFHHGYVWSDDEQQGVIDVLRSDRKARNVHVEYMDSKYHTDAAYLAGFRNLLHLKYRDKKMDVVITLDNEALVFAMENRRKLFAGIPIVFCGVNGYSPVMLRGEHDVTGVAQNFDPAGTLDIMLKLHPTASDVLIINDFTMSGRSFRSEIETITGRYASRVKISHNRNVSLEELAGELRRLPEGRLVLLQSFVRDKTNRVLDWRHITELLSRESAVPVYGVHGERLGMGIVGGKLLSGRRHGSDAAALALRVLAGESATSIPVVTESGAGYMFDAHALARWDISETLLPEDSLVINRPVSFFAANKKVIIIASQIIFVLCIIIVFLMIHINQRRRAALALGQSEKQFRELADHAPDAIFIETREQFVYGNDAFCRLIGAPSYRELLGRSVYDVFPSGDHALVKERIRLLNSEHQPVPITERKYLRLDGTPVDVEITAVPFKYQGEQGALVFARDIGERKAAEESLKLSEERFRSIVENTTAGYFFVELSGVVKDANIAWAKIYGYENREDVIGRNFLSLQNDDDIEKIREAVRGVLHDQKEYLSGVSSRKLRCGEIGYQTYSARAVRKDGKVVGVEGFIIDTTALRRAEDALRANELKFRSLFDNMTEGVALHELIYDSTNRPTDYRILDINPAYERHTGLKACEVKGQSAKVVYHDGEAPFLDIYARVAKTGQPYSFEPFFSPLKKHFSVSVFSPAVGQFATVFQDITDRKKMEAALAEEKERLLVTLRSIGDGVITTDIAGRIAMLNKVAEDLTGWTNAEALGQPLGDVFCIIHEETRQRCENPVQKVLESGHTVGLANHTVLISRDGTERVIADSAAPIRNRENQVIGVVLVFRDTTAKKRMEDAIRNSEKLEAVGVLAGGIAHDFNNLLSGIYGYLEVIKRGVDCGEVGKVSECIAKALATYERAKHITHQLLTFSKGGMPIRQIHQMDRLIRASVSYVVSGSNITVSFNIPDGPWPCNCDRAQISQVLDNIVTNARESMPGGGNLEVSLSLVGPDQAPAALLPVHYLLITICDRGSGITKENLPHIFDPFFTTRHQGSGLGLATCYSIIKKHNGHIEAESIYGEGSVFRIYLPQALDVANTNDATESKPNRGSRNVLIMDDEDFILDVVSGMLKASGFIPVTARDGDEAISKVKKASSVDQYFIAAILDLTIPGGRGGKETVKELLEIDPDLKVVASSGYCDDPIMASPINFGFSASLIKPFRLQDLADVLKNLIP